MRLIFSQVLPAVLLTAALLRAFAALRAVLGRLAEKTGAVGPEAPAPGKNEGS